ncbi:MAG: hypothetical protein BAJALOKI2v1_130034 [Promethearchaeota archaeon]|nr:MAG: hypothetical protein BAJALOKI2v1_130034 [Candidatus Lokiarchaeota archaeon]
MRPPICYICNKRFTPNEGGLIYFKRRESDVKWDKKAEDPGFVGHPPYAEWFCEDHYNEAYKRKHLTIDKAKKELRDIFL